MQYKSKVLKRFPSAEPFVADRWPDGSPRRVVIRVPNMYDIGHTILDIGDSDQGHTAAWRNAHYWCIRNPDRN